MAATGQKVLISDIGAQVRVDLTRVSEKLPKSISDQIKENPVGTVIDYKMTDATGIGVIVRFENGLTSWFFRNEIHDLSKSDNGLKPNHESEYKNDIYKTIINNIIVDKLKIDKHPLNKNKKYLLNPISFMKWFIYSLKDVV